MTVHRIGPRRTEPRTSRVETELPALLSRHPFADFSFHSTRMRMHTVSAAQLGGDETPSASAASMEIADASPDVILYACLVALMVGGPGEHGTRRKPLSAEQLANRWIAGPWVRFQRRLRSSRRWRAIDAGRIALVTPLPAATRRASRRIPGVGGPSRSATGVPSSVADNAESRWHPLAAVYSKAAPLARPSPAGRRPCHLRVAWQMPSLGPRGRPPKGNSASPFSQPRPPAPTACCAAWICPSPFPAAGTLLGARTTYPSLPEGGIMSELPHTVRGVDHVAFPTFDPAGTVAFLPRRPRFSGRALDLRRRVGPGKAP